MNNRNFNSISELIEYKETLKLTSNSIFTQYLSKIYENLLQREEIFHHSNSIKIPRNSRDLNTKDNIISSIKNSSSLFHLSQHKNKIVDKGISLKSFLEYMDIQEFIGERIFKYINNSKTIKLNKNDFCTGLNELYYGDIRNLLKFTFSLADFNKNGMIYKFDMKLILAYIPAATELIQKLNIKQINKIINNFFDEKIEKPEEGEEKELNFSTYSQYIEEYINNNKNNSELLTDYNNNAPFFYYISILSYLFKNCPFNAKNVDYFIYTKKKIKLKLNRNNVRSFSQRKICSTSKKDLNSTILGNSNKFDSNINGIQTIEKSSNKILIDAAIAKIDKKNLFKTKKSSSQVNIKRENGYSSVRANKLVRPENKRKDIKKEYIIAKEKEEKNFNILSMSTVKESKANKNLFNKRFLKSKKTISPQNHENLLKKSSSPLIGNPTSQSFIIDKMTASPDLLKNRKMFNINNSNDSNGSSSKHSSSNNLINLNSKTNFPSIFTIKEKEKQKMIPLSVGTKFKDKIDDIEEPGDFVLCEYSNDEDEDDVDKNNKNISKDNNSNSNEVFLYKIDEDDNSIKKVLTKYYAMLSEKEILFFTSELKNELSDIWFIDKTFILTNKEHINGSNYYTIIITFTNNTYNKLFFLTEKTCINFAKKIKHSIKDLDFYEHYELLDELGQGHFGKVFKCKCINTGIIYAVKVINKTLMKSKDLELIQQEKNYLDLIKHQNIISLKDYYEDKKNIFLITECYNGGDLLTYLENKQKEKEKVSEKDAAKIIKKIADGIRYLNFFGIIHRDIKPENIMFEKKNDIKSLKIIDLGVCQTLSYGEMASEPIGTNGYISPEIYLHHNYSFKVDVWSLGVILYLIITGGILPFDDEKMDSHVIGKKVIYIQQEYPEEFFGNKSKRLIVLLDKMLEKNDQKRFNIHEVLKDSWFDIIKK